ncbi:MAG: rRNA maturation RNase YbeY [Chloroflexi bacterium]|nr:rRNA maturation RNase YbeY [Chloroflexota bacterium]
MRSIYRAPWRVDLTIREGVWSPVSGVGLARVIAVALGASGAPSPASIGLILSHDAELATLNAAHLGHKGPTDVLSFPLLSPDAFPSPPPDGFPRRDGGPARGVWAASGTAAAAQAFVLPPGRRTHLGDIVVSVERAVEQAAGGHGGQTGDVRWSPADELRLLVTHGALHVCGWDHAEPAEEAAMRALEGRLLG